MMLYLEAKTEILKCLIFVYVKSGYEIFIQVAKGYRIVGQMRAQSVSLW
jgi:hypothetical protein